MLHECNMHISTNMYVFACNMHVTCTLFRIGLMYELNRVNLRAKQAALVQQSIGAASERMGHLQALLWQSNLVQHSS